MSVDVDDSDSDSSTDDSDDETTTTTTASDTTSTTSSCTTMTTTSSQSATASEDTSSAGSSSRLDTSTSLSTDSVSGASTSTAASEVERRKNFNRDFASLNPREGKEADQRTNRSKCVLSYSTGASPRLSSPYTQLGTDLDGQPVAAGAGGDAHAQSASSGKLVYNASKDTWTLSNLVYDELSDQWLPAEGVALSGTDDDDDDDDDDENASVGSLTSEDDADLTEPGGDEASAQWNESNKRLTGSSELLVLESKNNVGCQTGVDQGCSPHVLGDNKWTSAVNVTCFASVHCGDATVQINSPDLLSDTSSSGGSCLADDEGYSGQEQSSAQAEADPVDSIPLSAAMLCQSTRAKSGSLFSVDSGLASSDQSSSSRFSSRPGSATSIAARVGSAGAFRAPAVATLYSDKASSAASSDGSAQASVTSACDTSAHTSPADSDDKPGWSS